MTNTPKHLLEALDLLTASKVPSARLLGATESLHARRMRDVFEDKNIVAIGISEKVTEKKRTGTLSLCFYVERKLPPTKLRRSIPPVIASPNGSAVFTDVKVIGKIQPEVNKRAKPLQSGFSVGHVNTSAGTLGALVKRDGKHFILSNSHVLALSGTAKKGDSVVYPGSADGGTTAMNLVGKLTHFAPFKVGDAFLNRVDAALAQVCADRLKDLNFALHAVRGTPAVIAPKREMTVVKRGRTTGDTEGVIEDINFRLVIDYAGVGPVGFLDQVLCTRYTKPGDSGSLVVDKKSGKIVGLHFAGAKGGSVFNPIGPVISALGFSFTMS